jgi:ArsR family transcriptional regulator
MSIESPKYLVMSQFARVAKALSHEHRLELLELLAQGERSVEVLAERCGLPVANVSQHLQHLRRGGLIVGRRDGKYIRYRISGSEVVTLLGTLRCVAERNLAEVREVVGGYFHGRDSLEPVSMGDLMQRLRDGLVTVIDVRPEDEFAGGHVPGALNIPLEELEAQLKELPEDREIIAYCRGPYCMLAFEAVTRLRREGRQARRMKDGFPEWLAAGHPVESELKVTA